MQKEKRTHFRFKKVPFYGEKQKATFFTCKNKKGDVLDLKRYLFLEKKGTFLNTKRYLFGTKGIIFADFDFKKVPFLTKKRPFTHAK